jgi:hypothetical protein
MTKVFNFFKYSSSTIPIDIIVLIHLSHLEQLNFLLELVQQTLRFSNANCFFQLSQWQHSQWQLSQWQLSQ